MVVSNSYPVNNQAFRARWWIDRTLREGATGVLIIQHPLGFDPIHWLSARASGRNGSTYFDMVDQRRSKLPKGTGLIVYSQYLTRTRMNNYPPETVFAAKWQEVVKTLQSRHKGSVRAAVFPYGGMQQKEIPLDI